MSADKRNNGLQVSVPEYFLQQHQACKKGLLTYKQKKDNDSLHQLRVAIKKGSAVLNLLYKLEPGFDYDQAYQPYSSIFKHAGYIREQILQRERLQEDSKTGVAKKTSVILKNLNQDFLKISTAELKKAEKELPKIKTGLATLKYKKIKSYCKKLFRKLKGKWKKNSSEGEIHQFRKHLKQLLYCILLLNEKERDKIISSKKHQQIDKMQDTIGQWHDNILLLNKISANQIKVSAPFLHSLQNETKELLKEIHQQGNKL